MNSMFSQKQSTISINAIRGAEKPRMAILLNKQKIYKIAVLLHCTIIGTIKKIVKGKK